MSGFPCSNTPELRLDPDGCSAYVGHGPHMGEALPPFSSSDSLSGSRALLKPKPTVSEFP